MTPQGPVRLISSFESTPSPTPSLLIATAEPPMSGEAVVLDAAGHALAMAIEVGRDDDDRRLYRWAYTGVGCQRVEIEARS